MHSDFHAVFLLLVVFCMHVRSTFGPHVIYTPSDRSDQTPSPDFQLVTFLRTLFFCSFYPSSSRPSHVSVYFCGLFFYIPGKKRNTQSLVHIITQETQLQPSSGEPSRNRSPLRLQPACHAGSQEAEKHANVA